MQKPRLDTFLWEEGATNLINGIFKRFNIAKIWLNDYFYEFFELILIFILLLFDFCEGCWVYNQNDPDTLILLMKN